MKVQPHSSKLTDQQRYLLNRIPGIHDMNGYTKSPKPTEVRRAEAIVARFEKAENLKACKARKRNEALIRKAREAVYFSPPEKALRIVQQCEKMLKGCPI